MKSAARACSIRAFAVPSEVSMADEGTYEAEEIRPNLLVTALAASPFAMIVPLLAAAALVHPAFAVFTVHLAIVGTLASVYVRRRNPWPRRVPVRVRVEDDALTIEDVAPARGLGNRLGVERVARGEITRGVLVPGDGESRVRLRRERRRDRELSMRRPTDAGALLSSLGLGVDQTVASFRGMSRTYASGPRLFATIFALVLPTMLIAGVAAARAPAAVPLVMLTSILAGLVLTLWPTRIEVGGDGILMRWLGSERFLSHAEIADVSVREHGLGNSRRRVVVLALRSGETVNVPSGARSWDAGNAEMLAARILDARRACEEGGVSPHALLRRDGRPTREWVRDLRAREVTSLRSAAVPKEHLWRVIEDKTAEAVERAAAVVALGPALNRGERARLTKAAKLTAAPKLRVVLESAPEAGDEEIAEMIEELDAGSTRASSAKAARKPSSTQP